jgi:glycine/D-amino acid oxidase-like deaminating enzyme
MIVTGEAAMADIFADNYSEDPYWWDLAPRPESDDQTPPSRADVVVVGSGNVGLSAALSLTRRGRDVVVLDAEAAGHGASTRNAGYLGRGLWFKYGDMVQSIGREGAGILAREAVRAHDYAAGLIRDEQITCFYRDTGRFIAAPSKAIYRKLEKDLELMRADGVPVDAEMIPAERQHEEIASTVYHGGQLLRGNGIIHAGLYHQGLVERVRAQGGKVIGFCPVTGISRENEGFTVTTPKGTIQAGEVFVATNGYTPKAFPWQRRRVIPVSAFMIATETLSPELMARVLPNGRPLIENRNTPLWIRPNEDGTRILFGGTTGEDLGSLPRKAHQLHGEMTRVVPDLEGVKLTHCWTGKVAFSFDMLPHTGTHDGVHYAMGWCAAGVPMGTYLGHKTALRIVGDPDAATPLDDRPFPTKPFYTGNPWFLRWAVAWLKHKDAKLMRE